MRKLTFAATVAFVVLTIPRAEAYPRQDFNPVFDRHALEYSMPRSWHPRHRIKDGHANHSSKSHRSTHTKIERQLLKQSKLQMAYLPHPKGCPRVAFCGCGAAQEVFKRNVRSLWLASAWYRFPASIPGPGKVAVRNHHVFVIREYLGNGLALAYDANSGGHKTRLHIRSLVGYSIRDPHGNTKLAKAY